MRRYEARLQPLRRLNKLGIRRLRAHVIEYRRQKQTLDLFVAQLRLGSFPLATIGSRFGNTLPCGHRYRRADAFRFVGNLQTERFDIFSLFSHCPDHFVSNSLSF